MVLYPDKDKAAKELARAIVLSLNFPFLFDVQGSGLRNATQVEIEIVQLKVSQPEQVRMKRPKRSKKGVVFLKVS